MRVAQPPAAITDRPLSAIDIVDGAFHALRQRPRALVVASAWVLIPLSALQLVIDAQLLGTGQGDVGSVIGPLAVLDDIGSGGDSARGINLLVVWLISAISGVSVARIVGGWQTGADISGSQAALFTVKRLPAILGVFVVTRLALALSFLVFVLPALWITMIYCLTSPVIALEDGHRRVSIRRALKRSSTLAKGSIGQVLVVMFILLVVSLVLQLGLVAVLNQVDLPDEVVLPLTAAIDLLFALLLVPLNGAAMALLYLDARFRTEGLDLDMAAAKAFGRG